MRRNAAIAASIGAGVAAVTAALWWFQRDERRVDVRADKIDLADGPVPVQQSTAAVNSLSQQHYLSGLISYQKGDVEKARDEWTLAAQLDPANPEIARALARLPRKAK